MYRREKRKDKKVWSPMSAVPHISRGQSSGNLSPYGYHHRASQGGNQARHTANNHLRPEIKEDEVIYN